MALVVWGLLVKCLHQHQLSRLHKCSIQKDLVEQDVECNCNSLSSAATVACRLSVDVLAFWIEFTTVLVLSLSQAKIWNFHFLQQWSTWKNVICLIGDWFVSKVPVIVQRIFMQYFIFSLHFTSQPTLYWFLKFGVSLEFQCSWRTMVFGPPNVLDGLFFPDNNTYFA